MIPLIDKDLDDYAAHHSIAPSALRVELQKFTYEHCANPQMVTGPLEGALLQMLTKISGAHRVLEVGTFTGYSALSFAEALPADGEVFTCEKDEQNAAIAREFFSRSPVGGKIHIEIGPALVTLATLATRKSGTFDLAFLDADKENYPAYFEAILPLLRPGGLLLADNVLWSGRVLKPGKDSDRAIVAFNDKVHKDPRVETVLLTVRDGVMVARKL